MRTERELESAIKELRRGRGLAVNAGAIGITLATATDPEERAQMAAHLAAFISKFCEAVDTAVAMPILHDAAPDHAQAFEELRGFSREVQQLDPTDNFASLTRDLATALTTRARTATLPAFYTFIRRFEAERAALTERNAADLRGQSEQLEKMFGEVEDIGRMIHLISLNASVEAARAGGESGRSFKVIADEIRSLAAKSAELIDTTRAALRSRGGRHG